MEIGIAHISDIHIKDANDLVTKLFSQLVETVFTRLQSCGTILVLITGDLAFSGKADQYETYNLFFEKLRETANEHSKILEIVICPGNHDCDFGDNSDVRDLLIDGVLTDPKKGCSRDIQAQLLSVQTNFFKFLETNKLTKSAKPVLSYCKEIQVGAELIQINVLNTAFMSKKVEEQGKLYFPIEEIESLNINENALQIFMLHHPLNWFESTNLLAIRKSLASRADVILTGHEHTIHVSTVRSHTLHTSYEYFEGSVLQPSQHENSSEFQILKIDLGENQLCHETLCFETNAFTSTLLEDQWRSFETNRNSYEAKIRESFRKWLNDVGANFSHPRKTTSLEFYDLFVSPDLREIQEGEKKAVFLERPIGDENFQEFLRSGNSVVVSASEQTGKTHLTKHLINQFISKGFLAVYIDCSEIKRINNIREAERLILKAIRSQFSGNARERYLSSNISKRLLVLDDFHRCNTSDHDKVMLLKYAENNFNSFVAMGDEVMQLEGLISDQDSMEELVQFTWFRLLELGHLKREELIENWLTLGRDNSLPEPELDRKLVVTKNLVDQLIGSKLLPPTPINLLIILQQIEVFSENPTAASGSSSGYLYSLLITHSLHRHLRVLSIDGANTYLTELAEVIWKNVHAKHGRLSKSDFVAFHEMYEGLHDLKLPCNELVESLRACEIFTKTESGYIGFKYKYSFYFFVAKAIAESDRLDKYLIVLLESIHTEQSTNILVFLTYHSKDTSVLSALTAKADSLFVDFEKCDFCKHNQIANDLVMGATQFMLPETSAKDNRRKFAEEVDERALNQIQPTEERELVDSALDLNTAFKTVQILGQVLRNTAESATGGQKDAILEACVSVGLRTLEFIINMIEEVSSEIIDLIAQKVLKDNSISMAQKREQAKKIVSQLLESTCTVTIKKISNSIGTQKLARTYARAFHTKDSTLTYQLIDISVKLDHFRSFPEADLERLTRRIGRDDLLAITVLKRLVASHFYLRNEKKSIRTKYCKILGITVPEPVKNPYLLEKPTK